MHPFARLSWWTPLRLRPLATDVRARLTRWTANVFYRAVGAWHPVECLVPLVAALSVEGTFSGERGVRWGDPARDALTWLPLPSNSDSRTAPDAFKTPTLDFGSLYGVRLGTPLGTPSNPFGSDRLDFASEIDVGDFRWNCRLLFYDFGGFT